MTDNIHAADRLAFKEEGMHDFADLLLSRLHSDDPDVVRGLFLARHAVMNLREEMARDWRRKAEMIEAGKALAA